MVTECTTVINISINDHKTNILLKSNKETLRNKSNICNQAFEKLKY